MFGGMATENNSEVTTLNVPLGILGHVASLLTASSAMEILKGF
jgi:hypothetical protein